METGFVLLTCIMFGLVLAVPAAEPTQKYTYNQRDSLVSKPIYFCLGSSAIDPAFEQNKEALYLLNSILTDTSIISYMDSVFIIATTSPDGNAANNRTLGVQRAHAVKDYIQRNYSHIGQDKIFIHSYIENWMCLLPMISSPTMTPYYSEIASILGQNLTPQVTELQLKAIDGGQAWVQIVRNYLPRMRLGATLVIYTQRRTPLQPAAPAEDSVQVSVRVIVATETIPIVEQIAIISPKSTRRPLFALKTNLLYDAMTALNIEIEVPIGQHWSVAGECIFPWWLSERKQHCLQSLSGYLEGRYWFGERTERRQLTGWFAGAYAGGGCYDVEWRDKGYQGEFIIPIALSGGYVHSIGRNLSMEYSLGLGYMRTSYREYAPEECSDGVQRLIRQRSDTFNWIGPTRIKISLVWMINNRKK